MAILRDAINALDPAPDKKKQLTLSLNLVSELSASKADQFEQEVKASYRTAGTVEKSNSSYYAYCWSHIKNTELMSKMMWERL